MEESSVGEKSGMIIKYIMEELIPNKQGTAFINEVLEILTLCTSTVIREGYCKDHYDDALTNTLNLIKSDLENGMD